MLSGQIIVIEMRELCLSLCAAYNARIRIVYVETTAESLFQRNREREFGVPATVLNRMLARWEVPDLSEAHRLEFVVN